MKTPTGWPVGLRTDEMRMKSVSMVPLEREILSVLSGHEIHAYAFAVEVRSGRSAHSLLPNGTVCRALGLLGGMGLASWHWAEVSVCAGYVPRCRLHRLTDAGRQRLSSEG